MIKYKLGAYGERWFKCLNPHYTQKSGRHECSPLSGHTDKRGMLGYHRPLATRCRVSKREFVRIFQPKTGICRQLRHLPFSHTTKTRATATQCPYGTAEEVADARQTSAR